MATRKREVVVRRIYAAGKPINERLEVHADAEFKNAIEQVEGVSLVIGDENWLYVETDPRYDTDEVAVDIERAILDAAEVRAEATVAEAERILAKEPAP